MPSNFKDIFKKNIFPFSLTDMVLLIDELDFPSVLFNFCSKEIICGNGEFIKLTGIGNLELMHIKIDQLFLSENNDFNDENSNYYGQLITKNKSKIPVSYSIKYVSEHGKISLLKILKSNSLLTTNFQPEVFFENAFSIFNKSLSGDISKVIQEIIGKAENTIGGYPKAIYKLKGEVLVNQIPESIFPKELPSIELDRINDLDIWYPGKRILCEAHRIGRRNGFTGLISAPLKNEHFQGLFISGIESYDHFLTLQPYIENYIKWANEFIYLTCEIFQTRVGNESLIFQEKIFQSFVEKANDILVILDNHNKIEFVSKKFKDMMNYSTYEILDKSIFEIIDNEKLKTALEGNRLNNDQQNQIVEIHNREGKKYLMEMKVESFRRSEEITKMITLSDRTHISELEKSISQIEKQASLGESIADFAHDARNPLNNISTGLQMLRKLYMNNDSLVEAVDRMQGDCIRMSDLIESVLSYSRQNVDDLKLIDLDALLRNIYKRFENKFVKNNIKTSYINNIGRTLIEGDFRSLERVFINLINNSIESMEGEEGELSILIKLSSKTDKQVEVSIADTGPGIPKDMLAKIFEPYVSGKSSGTGLGLAITKKIIDAHNGKIEIESFTSGTIFRIFFNSYMEET